MENAMTNPRLKRLTMRSWRRGTKEMDLILGPFADTELAGLTESELDLFEMLLEENDHDLYGWITARIGGDGVSAATAGPETLIPLLDRIAGHALGRLISR